jgi:hypothetical protein
MASSAGEKRSIPTASAAPMFEFIRNHRPSQAAFAAEIDETKQTITNWRKRGIPLHAVAKVAARMGWTYEKYMDAAAGKAPVREDGALSLLARDIALRWMELSPDRQDWFRDLIFSMHFMEARFPAMKKGRPRGESYSGFERAVERDMAAHREPR